MLFSTANPSKRITHKILECAVQFHEQELQGKAVNVARPPKNKLRARIAIKTLWFASIFGLRMIDHSSANLLYDNVGIGRLACSTAFRDPFAYRNSWIFWVRFLKALYICILRIDDFNEIKHHVKAVYVNDPPYFNGVYCDLATNNSIPLYHNCYPYTLTRFTGGTPKELEEKFVYPLITPDSQEAGKIVLDNIVNDTCNIPYMNDVQFTEGARVKGISDAYALIYAHSFTDAQLHYGSDNAFLNMYDWLVFTLKTLKDKRVILKAHPGFYRQGYEADVVHWDKLVWDGLVRKYASRNNVTIIDSSIRNKDLLDCLDKETILISHHGNALLEGGALGFKCVSSKATPWHKFNLFNTWRSRNEYKLILNNPAHLSRTNLGNLYIYLSNLYTHGSSFASDRAWNYVIAEALGISATEFSKNPSRIKSLSDNKAQDAIRAISSNIFNIDLKSSSERLKSFSN